MLFRFLITVNITNKIVRLGKTNTEVFFMYKKGRTYFFDAPALIVASAGVAGKKEGEGPLGEYFDEVFEDTAMGVDTFEQAESAMLREAFVRALSKAGKAPSQVDLVMCGDLLNQCVGSCFALKDLDIPFVGMYGACSTMALTLCNACFAVEAGANTVAVGASSHFASSERQFRFPLEYGGQRPQTAQWTVTGAGSAVMQNPDNANQNEKNSPHISAVRVGKITDLGIKDANNMGAAMAPAAADTIGGFLADTGTSPEDYDMIVTGDLGLTGTTLLYELMDKEYGVDIRSVHKDCGLMIFDLKKQDVHSGGSGCGCSASVLCSYLLGEMNKGRLHKILFTATGALMSPTSCKQGQSIPSVAHAVLIEK